MAEPPADPPPASGWPSGPGPGPAGPPDAGPAPAARPAGVPAAPAAPPASPSAEAAAEAYEAAHVHDVYASIAPHFSATRHRPWPLVAAFLAAQPPGAVGLDVGCGNGKYLALCGHVALLGCDRSAALAGLARARTTAGADDVLVADGLALPFRHGAADFAICVAVVHHLSTRARRVAALRALLACVAPARGRVLVYVWALEQAGSRRGWAEGGEQDLLVPWVVKAERRGRPDGQRQAAGGDADETFQRYYHLYRRGELEEDVVAAGGTVLDSGYEKDNWWAIAGPGEHGAGAPPSQSTPLDPS